MQYLASLLNSSRLTKKAIFMLNDVFLLGLSFWLSIGLRVGVLKEWRDFNNWFLLCLIVTFSLIAFNALGLYRTVIRYSGLKLVRQVALGCLISVTLLLAGGYFIHANLPRSVPFSYVSLLSIFLIGSRFTVKGILQGQQKNRNRPILIYGAGAAGRLFYATAMKTGELLPVAFVDDSPSLHQHSIHDLTIYSPEQLTQVVDRFGVEVIVLAIPNASQSQRKSVLDKLLNTSCQILSVPNMHALNLLGEAVGIGVLKKVSVIDLLGRDSIKPIPELMNKDIHQKVVMVTGAGGSIGSELCRQIVSQNPKLIILFELSESALYDIEQELKDIIKVSGRVVKSISIIGSVNDFDCLMLLMKNYHVDTVYHAAAYKHVPLVENNIVEGVRNNVLGTLYCAKAAISAQVKTFVLISTDKAVRSTSIMGASKRMAELILQALSEKNDHRTCFSMVRFGNVLGSSGSVIPLFEKQIAQGGPVTVTHPEMTRYFMTIPEAAQLVIQAGAMSEGGDVFLLDMGESVKITDLAKKMVLLSGLSIKDEDTLEGDIELVFTGLRAGEKLYEELLVGENAHGTVHPRIMTTKDKMLDWESLSVFLDDIEKACYSFDISTILNCLQEAPTDFRPLRKYDFPRVAACLELSQHPKTNIS